MKILVFVLIGAILLLPLSGQEYEIKSVSLQKIAEMECQNKVNDSEYIALGCLGSIIEGTLLVFSINSRLHPIVFTGLVILPSLLTVSIARSKIEVLSNSKYPMSSYGRNIESVYWAKLKSEINNRISSDFLGGFFVGLPIFIILCQLLS